MGAWLIPILIEDEDEDDYEADWCDECFEDFWECTCSDGEDDEGESEV